MWVGPLFHSHSSSCFEAREGGGQTKDGVRPSIPASATERCHPERKNATRKLNSFEAQSGARRNAGSTLKLPTPTICRQQIKHSHPWHLARLEQNTRRNTSSNRQEQKLAWQIGRSRALSYE